MIQDYLSAEAPTIERLREMVTGAQILSAGDLAGVAERSQVTPAVHVLYDGDVLTGGELATAGRGAARMVLQRWLAVVVVRSARDSTGAAARAAAGPLISAVLGALQGFAPTSAHGEFQRVTAPRPLYRPSGIAYFPLAFTSRIAAVAAT